MREAKLLLITTLSLLLCTPTVFCQKSSYLWYQRLQTAYEQEKEGNTTASSISSQYEVCRMQKLDRIKSDLGHHPILMAYSENMDGKQDFTSNYESYFSGFSHIDFKVIDEFRQGDKIVKYWRFKGTHTGVFLDIPATGRKVNIHGVTIVEMKNKKIVREQNFIEDPFMLKLGIIPEE